MDSGDLVWLPAGTTLLQFGDEEMTVKRHKSSERPMNVLLVERHDYVYWKILYEGEQWCVPQHLLFPGVKEG